MMGYKKKIMQENMKLYSVEMTETELRLFSEFLEQREFEKKGEILIGNDGIPEVDDPIVEVQEPNNPGLRISYSPPTSKSQKPLIIPGEDAERGRSRDNFHISDINRKGEDTRIGYNEATGRSLNKDAAIAAGVTAGLGLGIHAIRKHNKKKKAGKDQIESKYKTKK